MFLKLIPSSKNIENGQNNAFKTWVPQGIPKQKCMIFPKVQRRVKNSSTLERR